MIQDCFRIPFIGLKLACDESSSSGLYINDLEGMSFRLTAKAAKDAYNKGEDLFRSKEKMAIIDTVRDFLLLVQKDFTFKDMLSDQYISGRWSTDYHEAHKFGFEVEKCQDNFIGLEVPYFKIFPEEKLQITVNVEVDGTVVKQVTQVVNAGVENTIFLDFKTFGSRVKVYTDVCGKSVKRYEACDCSCHQSCGGCAWIRPIQRGEEWEYSGHYKAGGQVICRCTFDHLVCMYKDKLALPILYHTGIKLALEFILTDNVDPFMENRKESANDLLLMWKGVPQEGEMFDRKSEYYKALYQVVLQARNYIKNTRTLCLNCETAQIVTHCLN